MDSTDNVYFAAKEPEETAAVLMGKTADWFQSLDTSGYLDKLKTMWVAYHGAYYANQADSHSIVFGGEQGELSQIAVNHLRNLSTHMLNMITATRPMMQARAINTDYKSLVQTKLANGLLDYYMRDHRLEEYLKTAVEYAIVFGSGYVKMEWNSTLGEAIDVDDETGGEIRAGDIDFQNLSPFDVMFDTNREDRKHDWVITRSFKNRFDLAAKYPEYHDDILALPTKSQVLQFSTFGFHYDDTDLVPVYEFFHKRTESMTDGRYLLFLDADVVLLDSPMPYRNLPVYCIAPSYYLGTPFGYTPMFDVLSMQDATNSLYSTILTNQTAFGVQNIVVPKSADVSIEQLSGGLNLIEADESQGQVRSLNLTNTPKEIFDFLAIMEKGMETISGINAVTRGNPDPSLRSGNALALVQSMSLQFMSGLQASYVMLIEDMGTGIINVLKDHASIPRIATIVGKNNRTELKEFVGDDLDAVNRVVVDIGNPLARTTAGRMEMASELLQMGLITQAKQYMNVLNTGNLDTMTENDQSQLMLVKDENENLVANKQVIAVFTDEHVMHIKEHSAVLANPDLRFDAELVQRCTQHIQEHINLLRNTDPDILITLGQQPLGQPPPAPPMPQGPPGGQPAQIMGQVPQAPPGLPSPPPVDPSLLPNPGLQDQQMAQLQQIQPMPAGIQQ